MTLAFGRRCGFASGRLLGATGPRMEPYNWKAKPISPVLGHMKRSQKLLCLGLFFQKLNGPLLTSGHDPRSTATSTFCATEILWDAADIVFEIADLATEGRLRRVEPFIRRQRQAALFGDRDEIAKVPVTP